MSEFDPDAYLSGGTAVAEPPKFDPDAYLSGGKPQNEFDASEYLNSTKAKDILDRANVVGEPRGGFGEFWKGLDLGRLPQDVAESLTPVTGSIRDLASSYQAARDVLNGDKTVHDAIKQYFPETQTLVGVENKSIRERLATGINTVMQLIFAKQVGEGMPIEPASTQPIVSSFEPVSAMAPTAPEMPSIPTIPEPPAPIAPQPPVTEALPLVAPQPPPTAVVPSDTGARPVSELVSQVKSALPDVEIRENTEGKHGVTTVAGKPVLYLDKDLMTRIADRGPDAEKAAIQEEVIHAQQIADGKSGRSTNLTDSEWNAVPADVKSALAQTHHAFSAERGSSGQAVLEYDRMRQQIESGGHITEWYNLNKRAAAERAEAAIKRQIAETGSKPAEKPPREFKTRPPFDAFGSERTPVAQFIINDLGGLKSKSAAVKQKVYTGNEALWDGAPKLSHQTHNKIYDPSGSTPDRAAQQLFEAGLIKDPYVDTMWQAIDTESKAVRKTAEAQREVELEGKRAIKQGKQFDKAQKSEAASGTPAVPARDLQVGDVVTSAGEDFKVTDIDPDTFDVTLEDGTKYGIQRVADNEVIYGEHKPSAPSVLKPGGELFSTGEIPFNLSGEPMTSEVGAEGQARFAAEARYAQDKAQDVFGFGPGAAAQGEIAMNASSQLKQLSDVVTEQLKGQQKSTATQRVATATKASNRIPGSKSVMQRFADAAKATGIALKSAYLSPPKQTDFISALKDWQGADQRTSFEVRKWIQRLRKQIDPLTDEAITNYIQTDGDRAVLAARAATSKPEFRLGYERALNLSQEEQTIAENGRQYFDAKLQDGINAGLMNQGVENYILQVWKKPNKTTNLLMADLQSGKLQKDFRYARHRIYNSFFEGEQAGEIPATKRFSDLVGIYDLAFNRSLSARGLIASLRKAKAPDGEPVVKFSGMVQSLPKDEIPPEAYLIRSEAMPETAISADGRRYLPINHPALRGWKLAYQEGAETPTYYQTDMLIHPDHWEHLNNVLKHSAWRSGKLGVVTSPLLKAGALLKQTRLSLSIFHLDQEGLHGLFHRVNPANLNQINFDDPTQWRLVRNGLQISDYSAMELFSEGLRGGGLVSKIPVIGELQNRFNEFLFKDYIPRLKMTMASHAFERNTKRYPTLAPDVIADLTARQANAAFGELNYKLMGRSPTVQDSLRLALLAPDFLEARTRFVGQALKAYGQEQRAALILGSAVLYVGGRALNQWLDNDPHWDKPFSVIYNGREYRLRTVMGDLVEALTDPRRFFYNRFSPWLRIGATLGSGRDYRGIKLTGWEQLKEALSWLVPIPLGQGNEANTVDQWINQAPQRMAAAAGISNKPSETPIDETYKAARKYKGSLTDSKIQQEVRRAQQETYAQGDYARLNRALIETDKERAVSEMVALMKEKGKTPTDLAKYYSNLPGSPFTGSRTLDAQWTGVMTPPERLQYNRAVAQRIGMAKLFAQLFPYAMQQNR